MIDLHPLDHPLACTWPIAFYFSKNSAFLSFLWPGILCRRNSRESVQAVHRQSALQRRCSLRELRWESNWQTRTCAGPVSHCLAQLSLCVLALFSLIFADCLLVIVLAVNHSPWHYSASVVWWNCECSFSISCFSYSFPLWKANQYSCGLLDPEL